VYCTKNYAMMELTMYTLILQLCTNETVYIYFLKMKPHVFYTLYKVHLFFVKNWNYHEFLKWNFQTIHKLIIMCAPILQLCINDFLYILFSEMKPHFFCML